LLDELGAECLVGNHEFCVWYGQPLELVEPDLHSQAEVTRRIDAGAWQLACCVEDVLVTHAGLSEEYLRRFAEPVRGDIEQLAAALNAEFASTVRRGPDASAEKDIDWESPLWYRPSDRSLPAEGIRQVAGHTPPESLRGAEAAVMWASHGFHLVDPYARRWVHVRQHRLPVPLRYAVIEGGTVRLVEG
jgi:hypothetical protein